MILCKFCDEKAVFVAPQYIGGNITGHIQWQSICKDHADSWYAGYTDLPSDQRIPMFVLTDNHHTVMATIMKHEHG